MAWASSSAQRTANAWQNPFEGQLIGTLRRNCLGQVIALNERYLRHIAARYLDYCRDRRTQLSLSMDVPNPPTLHPLDRGRVVEVAELGDLRHRTDDLLRNRGGTVAYYARGVPGQWYVGDFFIHNAPCWLEECGVERPCLGAVDRVVDDLAPDIVAELSTSVRIA